VRDDVLKKFNVQRKDLHPHLAWLDKPKQTVDYFTRLLTSNQTKAAYFNDVSPPQYYFHLGLRVALIKDGLPPTPPRDQQQKGKGKYGRDREWGKDWDDWGRGYGRGRGYERDRRRDDSSSRSRSRGRGRDRRRDSRKRERSLDKKGNATDAVKSEREKR